MGEISIVLKKQKGSIKTLELFVLASMLLLASVAGASAAVVIYDTNGDGVIQKTEAAASVVGYFDNRIAKAVAIEVVEAYFGGGLSSSLSTAAASPGTVTRSFSTTTPAAGAAVTVTLTPGGIVTGGFYQVAETIPAGFTFVSTTSDNAAQTGKVITFTQLTGVPFTYTVTAPTTDGTFTFSGTFKDNNRDTGIVGGASQITVGAAAGSISGMKFNDLNGNGVNDAEPGLANWTIRLLGFDNRNNKVVSGTVVTDPNGNYSFRNLKPGFYYVSEGNQPGFVATTLVQRTVRIIANETVIVNFGNKKIR